MYLISNMILTTNHIQTWAINHIQTSCEWTQNSACLHSWKWWQNTNIGVDFFLCCSICSTFSFYGPNKFHLKKHHVWNMLGCCLLWWQGQWYEFCCMTGLSLLFIPSSLAACFSFKWLAPSELRSQTIRIKTICQRTIRWALAYLSDKVAWSTKTTWSHFSLNRKSKAVRLFSILYVSVQ